MNERENERENEKKHEEKMKMVDWPLANRASMIIYVALFPLKSTPVLYHFERIRHQMLSILVQLSLIRCVTYHLRVS